MSITSLQKYEKECRNERKTEEKARISVYFSVSLRKKRRFQYFSGYFFLQLFRFSSTFATEIFDKPIKPSDPKSQMSQKASRISKR